MTTVQTPTALDRLKAAIRATGDMMQADDARCTALYGAPVGVPVFFVDSLIRRVTHGTRMEWDAEYVRRALTESPEAVKAWAADLDALKRDVFNLLYPQGLHSPSLTSAQVHAIADELTAVPAR
ncbi:hypothetical protein ACIO3O_37015 [Streptomyces sp. NPDC087440]|uniref:hypothetical protein n=1 Tax=Streptomyces sp. NPDC087440 TaxID=3365790 RepID=UPI00380A502E